MTIKITRFCVQILDIDSKYKNNNKKGYCNYEQRDYDKEGFDWNSLYANNNFTS